MKGCKYDKWFTFKAKNQLFGTFYLADVKHVNIFQIVQTNGNIEKHYTWWQETGNGKLEKNCTENSTSAIKWLKMVLALHLWVLHKLWLLSEKSMNFFH